MKFMRWREEEERRQEIELAWTNLHAQVARWRGGGGGN